MRMVSLFGVPEDGVRLLLGRRTRTAVTTAVVAATLIAGVGPAAGASTAERLERAERERDALAQRLDEVTEELEDLAVRIEQAQERRSDLEDEVEALERDADRADERLEELARERYRRSQQDPMVGLLESGGPDAAMERARLLSGVGRADAETMEVATAARRGLVATQAELDEVLDQLAEDQARADELREEVEVAFGEAAAETQVLMSRRERQRELDRAGQNGTYACPLAPPFSFRDTWGAPRSGGRSHKGVDMFAPMGGDVLAITDGTIARHSNSGLGGIGLYLRGDDGNLYYYAHLQRILSAGAVGNRVEAGEHIAENGDTGNARGGSPHVHFQVHPGGGGPVNPYPYSAAACF
jgi:murein DD-endopeptidase MepM/ murein hydrolase activator NlpD